MTVLTQSAVVDQLAKGLDIVHKDCGAEVNSSSVQEILSKSLQKESDPDVLPGRKFKQPKMRTLNFVPPKHPRNAKQFYKVSDKALIKGGLNITRGQGSGFPQPSKVLYALSDANNLMGWRKVQAVGAGLNNLGFSCFMNATIQCLVYTSALQNYIDSSHHSRSCKTVDFCLFCQLHKDLPLILSRGKHTIFSPRTVFRSLSKIGKCLRPGRQEDAHEFLMNFLETLHKNALKIHGKIDDERVKETSVIHKIFGGYLRSQVKCLKCKFESNTYDACLDLSLEITKGRSVDRALKHFTVEENLTHSDKYYCVRCRKKQDAQKQMTIFEPPLILIVHLKRFESNPLGSGKINKPIMFKPKISLDPFMSYKHHEGVNYSLYGVLVHSGFSMDAGHYYSYIKSPSGVWYQMNDTHVRRTSLSEVLSQKAYILFYSKDEKKTGYRSPNFESKVKSKKLLKTSHKGNLNHLTHKAASDPKTKPLGLMFRKVQSTEVSLISAEDRTCHTKVDRKLISRKAIAKRENYNLTLQKRNSKSDQKLFLKEVIPDKHTLISKAMICTKPEAFDSRDLRAAKGKRSAFESKSDGKPASTSKIRWKSGCYLKKLGVGVKTGLCPIKRKSRKRLITKDSTPYKTSKRRRYCWMNANQLSSQEAFISEKQLERVAPEDTNFNSEPKFPSKQKQKQRRPQDTGEEDKVLSNAEKCVSSVEEMQSQEQDTLSQLEKKPGGSDSNLFLPYNPVEEARQSKNEALGIEVENWGTSIPRRGRPCIIERKLQKRYERSYTDMIIDQGRKKKVRTEKPLPSGNPFERFQK